MGSKSTGIADKLAEYAHDLKYDSIPIPVIERTKTLFLDFLGVAFGGLRIDSTRPTLATLDALQSSSGSSTILGQTKKFTPHLAALMNAMLAHSMDFDDTHSGSIMHVGSPLFATLLALGEQKSVSGKEFLQAAVAGYDVAAKLGRAHGDSVHRRGFHPTATTGIFACTVAGGRLLGLTVDQIVNAIGINVSQAAGSQQFLENGAWTKRLHVGLSAHNAIYSLMFAGNGFIGAAEPIEGRFGYLNLYSEGGYDLSKAVDGLGDHFEVMDTAIKPYPCCRYNHGAIDAVIEINKQQMISSRTIKSIDVFLGPTAYTIVAEPEDLKRMPANLVECQFSVFFAVAEAVLNGTYSWSAYDHIGDIGHQDMMSRINVYVDEKLSGFQSRTRVVTVAGDHLEFTVPFPKGEPENPMKPDEVAEKFLGLASTVIGMDGANNVIGAIDSFERLTDINDVTCQMR